MVSTVTNMERGRESTRNGVLSPLFVLSVLLVPRLLAARYSIIGDCDEVFNYWEPTHYLVHGSGFQTWEYSPVYAIRSWAYIAIHAAVIKALQVLNFSKVQQFYGLRIGLGIISALSETVLVHYVQLYKSVSVGKSLLYLLSLNAGMFVASTAFLPSSFAMYGVTLAHAFSLQPPSKRRTLLMFAIIGFTAILSWPFAAVLAVVLLCHDLVQLEWSMRSFRRLSFALLGAALVVLGCLTLIIIIDSAAYRRFQIVPLNIITYNVFSGDSGGPNLYGTEPWWYYFLNLGLYFNIILVAACSSFPLLAPASFLRKATSSSMPVRDNIPLASIYLWLVIFSMQPHKEERFMYVIYPLICCNAAQALETCAELFQQLFLGIFQPSFIRRCIYIFRLGILLVYSVASLARVLALVRAYAAPMEIYEEIKPSSTICLAKEWYRYPSSFFIPSNSQAFFVKSAFDGLLPGRFYEPNETYCRSGTWRIPVGMNDQNKEDLSHLVDIAICDYLVDSDFPLRHEGIDSRSNSLEPREFLDPSHSGLFGRAFWLPIHGVDKSAWGEFCLLQRAYR